MIIETNPMKNRDVGAVLKLRQQLWIVGSSTAGYHVTPYISTTSDADDGFIFCMFEVLDALGFEVLHMQGFVDNDPILSNHELETLFQDAREHAPAVITDTTPTIGH
ncbi:MAG: hypothetical protein AAFV29_14365 [Myxococcota bacterium]